MLHTTFELLRKAGACVEGYRKLARHLGGVKKYGSRKEIPFSVVLESNDLEDAVWCFRAVVPGQEKERDRIARLFACRCVRETPLADGRKVWDLLTDDRSRNAVEVAERYAHGMATEYELAAACDAAMAAAWDAQAKILFELLSEGA